MVAPATGIPGMNMMLVEKIPQRGCFLYRRKAASFTANKSPCRISVTLHLREKRAEVTNLLPTIFTPVKMHGSLRIEPTLHDFQESSCFGSIFPAGDYHILRGGMSQVQRG